MNILYLGGGVGRGGALSSVGKGEQIYNNQNIIILLALLG